MDIMLAVEIDNDWAPGWKLLQFEPIDLEREIPNESETLHN
jgi:hypothetical protein